jgi:hypothetical protein
LGTKKANEEGRDSLNKKGRDDRRRNAIVKIDFLLVK